MSHIGPTILIAIITVWLIGSCVLTFINDAMYHFKPDITTLAQVKSMKKQPWFLYYLVGFAHERPVTNNHGTTYIVGLSFGRYRYIYKVGSAHTSYKYRK